jgi:hypothetical protein
MHIEFCCERQKEGDRQVDQEVGGGIILKPINVYITTVDTKSNVRISSMKTIEVNIYLMCSI